MRCCADAASSLLLLSVCKEESCPSLDQPQPPHHEEMSSPARTVSINQGAEDHLKHQPVLKEEPEDHQDLCKSLSVLLESYSITKGESVSVMRV